MFNPNTGAPMPPGGPQAHYNPHAQPYDPYGFDDDGYGSGALYPGGPMGLKNKRAETDRECELTLILLILALADV